jgi:hypothetical protein
MTFEDSDVPILWAAMIAMVKDNHAPQDNLSEKQWRRAADLYSDLYAKLHLMMDQNILDSYK